MSLYCIGQPYQAYDFARRSPIVGPGWCPMDQSLVIALVKSNSTPVPNILVLGSYEQMLLRMLLHLRFCVLSAFSTDL